MLDDFLAREQETRSNNDIVLQKHDVYSMDGAGEKLLSLKKNAKNDSYTYN